MRNILRAFGKIHPKDEHIEFAISICPRLMILAVGFALVSLSACSSFTDKPISAEVNAGQLQTRSLSDLGLAAFLQRNIAARAGKQPPTRWGADDLTMAAFYYNPDLDIARAQLAAARAAGITAGEIPNPTINLTPTYDTTRPPPWILGLSFDIPIETAGKRGYREGQAEHLTDAAIANLTGSAWKVRGQIRIAFLALYAALQRQPLLGDQEAAESESVRILEKELAIGEVSPFEMTQSRMALNQIRFAQRDNETEIAGARARLAAAIGIAPAALAGVQFDFSAFERFPPDIQDQEARRQALVARADVRAGLADYAASQSALQLEIAKQYPDIHLGPGYQRDQADDKWTLGLTFTLPIFNQNQGQIAQAEARRAQAAANFDSLQTRILSDVEQATTGYRGALKKVDAAKALREDLASQATTADNMLKLGEISRIELAQRKLELTNSSLAQLDALVGAQTALGTLEDLLQSPKAVATVTEEAPRKGADATSPQLPLKLSHSVALPNVKGEFDLMTVDVPGRRLFVDAQDNNSTEVINLATNTASASIPGMHQPKWEVYRPELNRLYVANGDGAIRVLDATTFALLRSIDFQEKANNLHFDPATGELFVGVGNTFGAIGIIDAQTDRIAGEIPLASSPNQFEIDGNRIYVNVPAHNYVAVIDRQRRVVVATWPLQSGIGNYPMGLDRTHHRLFVGFKPGRLAVLDTMTGKEIASLDIGTDADGIHYDEERGLIYVSCGEGWIDVIRQLDADHYSSAGRIPTAEGAGTSLFVPALDQFFLAVPQRGDRPAEIKIYTVNPR